MLKIGQIVKFHTPHPSEVEARFKVLELRGDRVLVEDANKYWRESSLCPQFVYQAEDLEADNNSIK